MLVGLVAFTEGNDHLTSPDIRTERLRLRRWVEADREPFARMNADPDVMAQFPAPLSRRDSDVLVDRIEAGFARHGFGLWALEVETSGEFIGFTGLAVPDFETSFTPTVEIGWRLARSAWGKGYATEAGRAVLDVAFLELLVAELVSFTAESNARSRAVMERLGLTRDPAGDFDHPNIAPGHPLCHHVLYRITESERRELTG